MFVNAATGRSLIDAVRFWLRPACFQHMCFVSRSFQLSTCRLIINGAAIVIFMYILFFCRVGDYKLISGFPGFSDGWEADGTLCFASKARFLTNGDGKDQAKEKEKFDPKKPLSSYYAEARDPSITGPYANALKDNVMLFNIKGRVKCVTSLCWNRCWTVV